MHNDAGPDMHRQIKRQLQFPAILLAPYPTAEEMMAPSNQQVQYSPATNPRFEGGASSTRYVGTAEISSAFAKPTRTLATKNCSLVVAVEWRIHETSTMQEDARIPPFLPNLSTTLPANNPPTIPPKFCVAVRSPLSSVVISNWVWKALCGRTISFCPLRSRKITYQNVERGHHARIVSDSGTIDSRCQTDEHHRVSKASHVESQFPAVSE